MSGHKIERITEDIKRELTAIFRELKDPRVTSTLVSIVRVEVTNDLSYCKIYVSTIDGIEKTNKAVLGLKSANGYIKHELGSRLKLRHIPELIFVATDFIEYGLDLSKKIDDLKGR